MEHLFWLENNLAGRVGPNTSFWDLSKIAAVGFSGILSVNDGEMCHTTEIQIAGMDYACFPFPNNAPPRPGDREICSNFLPQTYEFAGSCLEKGKLLVHCTSGKDRTGLFMAYYLMRQRGLGAKESMQKVLQVRPIAFSAEGYFDFCQSLLQKFEGEYMDQLYSTQTA